MHSGHETDWHEAKVRIIVRTGNFNTKFENQMSEYLFSITFSRFKFKKTAVISCISQLKLFFHLVCEHTKTRDVIVQSSK